MLVVYTQIFNILTQSVFVQFSHKRARDQLVRTFSGGGVTCTMINADYTKLGHFLEPMRKSYGMIMYACAQILNILFHDVCRLILLLA